MFGVERVAGMNILVFGLGRLALVGTLGAWSRKHGAGGRREGERGGKREREMEGGEGGGGCLEERSGRSARHGHGWLLYWR